MRFYILLLLLSSELCWSPKDHISSESWRDAAVTTLQYAMGRFLGPYLSAIEPSGIVASKPDVGLEFNPRLDDDNVIVINGNPVLPRRQGPRQTYSDICTDDVSCSLEGICLNLDVITAGADVGKTLSDVLSYTYSELGHRHRGTIRTRSVITKTESWRDAAVTTLQYAVGRISGQYLSVIEPSGIVTLKPDIDLEFKPSQDGDNVLVISGNPVRPRRQGPRQTYIYTDICTDAVLCSLEGMGLNLDGITTGADVAKTLSDELSYKYSELAHQHGRKIRTRSLIVITKTERDIDQFKSDQSQRQNDFADPEPKSWSSVISTFLNTYTSAMYGNIEYAIANVYRAVQYCATSFYAIVHNLFSNMATVICNESYYRLATVWISNISAFNNAFEKYVANAYLHTEMCISNFSVTIQKQVSNFVTRICDVPIPSDTLIEVWTSPTNLLGLIKQWINRHLVRSSMLTRHFFNSIWICWQPYAMFKYELLAMTLICLCSLLFLYNTRKPEHEPGTNEEAFSATRRDQRPAVSSSAAADPDDPVNCDIHNPVLNNTGISNSRCDDAKYTEVAVLPGTYGRIFVVTDPGQQLYALKMHSCEKQNNGIAEVGSLEVEIKMLSSLRHPNIIKLIDADYNMNKFLVSRLYENGDLRSFYDHYRLPCHLQLRVILGIASALSYLHKMHYAHRSLRPGHVLLDGQFVPRLSGFGYATYCICADGQRPLLQEERQNSLAYSPVEALGLHNPQIADIYSLGALFYFILFGCDVFAGVPFEARPVPFEKSDNLSPCGWEEADPGWCLSLVERMLSRQPDPRPTAEDVMQIVERNAQ